MSLLFKQLRIHQIFGANTDVGKTILTTALTRSSAKTNHVFYLKPISTGPMKDTDDEHIQRYAGRFTDRIHTACLYRYAEPVSPHLAAKYAQTTRSSAESLSIPQDSQVVGAIESHVQLCAAKYATQTHMYIETAGGVHSPMLSGTSQADGYRPLFLPTILVGDSKLGGISSTIAAYESLTLRGYIIDAILIFRDTYYRNWEYLTSYFAERQVHVSTFDSPPPISQDTQETLTTTEQYYDDLVSKQVGLSQLQEHLDGCHLKRLDDLHSMPRRSLDHFWWPFVQHGLVRGEGDVNVIDSANSDFFSVLHPVNEAIEEGQSLLTRQFDGSASWWTQAVGHSHPSLTLAAARASGRYGHVMFPKATHLPALQLAERLIQNGPGKGWASRAFFSDDGSTGMEIALKMALRSFCRNKGMDIAVHEQKTLGVLGLKGSYHGDTIGAMDACEEGVYTCEWHHAKGYWMDPPTISVVDAKVVISVPPSISSDHNLTAGSLSWAYDVNSRLDTKLARTYRNYIQETLHRLQRDGSPRLAALVIEPLVMGAGGMIFVDPLFQRILVEVSRTEFDLPVIFDEVFIGLYRVGVESSNQLLGVNPDISVNAKILTGGLVPLAVTLASESIFNAFWSDKKEDALLHGHSYSAHAVGCEVANETLKLIDGLTKSDAWNTAKGKWDGYAKTSSTVWSFWDPRFVETVSETSDVEGVMSLGTVLSIKFKDNDAGYLSQTAESILRPLAQASGSFKINFRTLGNVAYFMTSLNTPADTIRAVEGRILDILRAEPVQILHGSNC